MVADGKFCEIECLVLKLYRFWIFVECGGGPMTDKGYQWKTVNSNKLKSQLNKNSSSSLLHNLSRRLKTLQVGFNSFEE